MTQGSSKEIAARPVVDRLRDGKTASELSAAKFRVSKWPDAPLAVELFDAVAVMFKDAADEIDILHEQCDAEALISTSRRDEIDRLQQLMQNDAETIVKQGECIHELRRRLSHEPGARHTLDCDMVKHPNCTRCNCGSSIDVSQSARKGSEKSEGLHSDHRGISQARSSEGGNGEYESSVSIQSREPVDSNPVPVGRASPESIHTKDVDPAPSIAAQPPPAAPKISLDGLEQLLKRESDVPVRVLTDGTVELIPQEPCMDCSQARVPGLIRCVAHAESHGRKCTSGCEKPICGQFTEQDDGEGRVDTYCATCGHTRECHEPVAAIPPGADRERLMHYWKFCNVLTHPSYMDFHLWLKQLDEDKAERCSTSTKCEGQP